MKEQGLAMMNKNNKGGELINFYVLIVQKYLIKI